MFWEISQNSQENTCLRVSHLIKLQAEAYNFIKKETLAQVFSCEICEISKNTFLTEHLRVTASVATNFKKPGDSVKNLQILKGHFFHSDTLKKHFK